MKETPEISGKTLARIPLNTFLDATEKMGEWYKVAYRQEGVQVNGFIHEMLVQETTEDSVAAIAEKPQAELTAEIDVQVENSRRLIREDKEYDRAIDIMRPLIARVFNVVDLRRRKEMAADIYLWIGLAYAGKQDVFKALQEFKSMFEVDQELAKEITRNIYDPEVTLLINQAEKEFLGIITEYSIQITTEPKEAVIWVNGKEIGRSPEVFTTAVPKLNIKIEKEGFAPVEKEIFLTEPSTDKFFKLEQLGRTLEIISKPEGSLVFVDEKNMQKETNCTIPFITFGPHQIRLFKKNYVVWEQKIEIPEAEEPYILDVSLVPVKYTSVKTLGDPDRKFIEEPAGVAVDAENNIYVVDDSNMKVKKFDEQGLIQSKWGDYGKEFKRIKSPAGVAVDSQGNVYVTDMKNHCVLKFNKDGEFMTVWGEEGTRETDFYTPLGIAVDANDDVFVVDSGNRRIVKYSSQGDLRKAWRKGGQITGNFISPKGVAVNKENEIFVLDRGRVHKFSPDGDFITSWGKSGTGQGEIRGALGIFIDDSEGVYIADTLNQRIQKFDKDGKFIISWGNSGTGQGQMRYPSGVAVDSRGYVFVSEKENNRIQVFGPEQGNEPDK
ncbi:MAG: PEGA domain-containing protein [Candidatus Aminicenantes bacterium]|nr:PEGA domain-containing protein [Candidatus Aminicenantes bacterium]